MDFISSSLSASGSFFPCHGSIFHPVAPSYALTPVRPCSENSSRTLFGRLFSWRMAASKPPPPVNFPVRRSVCTAWILSMPPTVFTYLAMYWSAVWARSGAANSASPASVTRASRIDVPSIESAFRQIGLHHTRGEQAAPDDRDRRRLHPAVSCRSAPAPRAPAQRVLRRVLSAAGRPIQAHHVVLLRHLARLSIRVPVQGEPAVAGGIRQVRAAVAPHRLDRQPLEGRPPVGGIPLLA